MLNSSFVVKAEFPLLSDILKRHGAEGEDELGQAQFAHLLQPVLQELADVLAEKPVVVLQKIKINNGSKLRKVATGLFFFFGASISVEVNIAAYIVIHAHFVNVALHILFISSWSAF